MMGSSTDRGDNVPKGPHASAATGGQFGWQVLYDVLGCGSIFHLFCHPRLIIHNLVCFLVWI